MTHIICCPFVNPISDSFIKPIAQTFCFLHYFFSFNMSFFECNDKKLKLKLKLNRNLTGCLVVPCTLIMVVLSNFITLTKVSSSQLLWINETSLMPCDVLCDPVWPIPNTLNKYIPRYVASCTIFDVFYISFLEYNVYFSLMQKLTETIAFLLR